MSKISKVVTIREFINDGITYGVYSLDFNGEQKIFIRNGDSVGVVSHLFGEPANKCVCIIRDDFKQEFLAALNSK